MSSASPSADLASPEIQKSALYLQIHDEAPARTGLLNDEGIPMKSNAMLRMTALASAFLLSAPAWAQATPTYQFRTPVAGLRGAITNLVASPETITFPDTVVGAGPVSASSLVSNASNQPVQLAVPNFTGSSAIAMSSTCGGTLNPGESCALGFSFMPGSRGLFQGAAVVNGNGQALSIRVSGRGTQGVLSASESVLEFGQTYITRLSPGQPVSLSNIGDAPVTGITASIQAPFVLSGNCGATLNAGAACELSISFAPTEQGERESALSVSSSVGGLVVQARGTGVELPRFASILSGDVIDFGLANTGSPAVSRAITLSNTGEAPLSISLGALPAGVVLAENTCDGVAPGASCTLTLSMQTDTNRSFSGQVVAIAGAQPGLQTTLSGAVQTLSASLAPVDGSAFPSTRVGEHSDKVLRLTNTGTGNLTFPMPSEASVTGVGFSFQSTTCSEPLAPAQSCETVVRFAPTEADVTHAGAMVITSNAGNHSVNLSGLGAAPGFASNQFVAVLRPSMKSDGYNLRNVSGQSVTVTHLAVCNHFSSGTPRFAQRHLSSGSKTGTAVGFTQQDPWNDSLCGTPAPLNTSITLAANEYIVIESGSTSSFWKFSNLKDTKVFYRLSNGQTLVATKPASGQNNYTLPATNTPMTVTAN